MHQQPESEPRNPDKEKNETNNASKIKKFHIIGARFLRFLDRHNGALNALGTLVIAAFTIVLAIATYELKKLGEKQSSDMERSIAASEGAAKATEKSAKASEQQIAVMQSQLAAIEADQRPWVFATNVIISRPIVRDEKGTNIQLMFLLKNGGRSPALQTSVRFRVYLRSVNYRDEEEIVCKDAQPIGFGATLFADTTTQQETGWLIPTQEIVAAQRLGVIITPFVVACVAYQFPRTKEYHSTPYEFMISPALGSTKWPCCSFPIDEREIAPSDLRLVLVPVTPPN